MRTQHTPGPWKLVKTNSGTICNDGSELVVYHDVKAACGNTVAAVYATYTSEENQTANAALISAAPDLLAVVQRIAAIWEDPDRTPSEMADSVDRNWIRAAITRATNRGIVKLGNNEK